MVYTDILRYEYQRDINIVTALKEDLIVLAEYVVLKYMETELYNRNLMLNLGEWKEDSLVVDGVDIDTNGFLFELRLTGFSSIMSNDSLNLKAEYVFDDRVLQQSLTEFVDYMSEIIEKAKEYNKVNHRKLGPLLDYIFNPNIMGYRIESMFSLVSNNYLSSVDYKLLFYFFGTPENFKQVELHLMQNFTFNNMDEYHFMRLLQYLSLMTYFPKLFKGVNNGIPSFNMQALEYSRLQDSRIFGNLSTDILCIFEFNKLGTRENYQVKFIKSLNNWDKRFYLCAPSHKIYFFLSGAEEHLRDKLSDEIIQKCKEFNIHICFDANDIQ